jgi:periplasmic protein TonB
MTFASPGSDPSLFSSLWTETEAPGRTRRDSFLVSLFAQALVLAVIIFLTRSVLRQPAVSLEPMAGGKSLPLIFTFTGHSGGGGGNFNAQPASPGTPPRAALLQLAPPDLVVPREMPKLPAEPTIVAAPDIKFPPGQIGDPGAEFSRLLSQGPGGPGGFGSGCCDGMGSSAGPFLGNGPRGIFPAGRQGVTVPEPIFRPEPGFSEEARKSKTEGTVTLRLVVGQDGRPYDIRVRQSLGMGLDEKAIDAVRRWRFRAATLNGQPVATEIEVEVNFHLY